MLMHVCRCLDSAILDRWLKSRKGQGCAEISSTCWLFCSLVMCREVIKLGFQVGGTVRSNEPLQLGDGGTLLIRARFHNIHPVSSRTTEKCGRNSLASLHEENKMPVRNVVVPVLQRGGGVVACLALASPPCPSLTTAASFQLWWRPWYTPSCQRRSGSTPPTCCSC